MELEDVVTFVQENLPCSSFTAFQDMRVKGVLCDMSLNIQDQSFAAHSVVLAAGIPYFNSHYMNGGEKIQEEELSAVNLDPRAVESLIQFAYTSTVSISFENVYYLMHASNFFQLIQVFDACVYFLLRRINNDNVVRIHNISHELKIHVLLNATTEHMCQNFKKIFKRDDFLNMPHSCVKEVISQDDLNVSKEETVFEAVVKWVAISPSDRRKVLPELLREIRMVFIHPDYLINQEASIDFFRASEPCMEMLEKVKNYHLLSKDGASSSDMLCQPRKFYCNEGGIYAIWYSQSTGYSVYHCDLDKGRVSHNLASLEGRHGDVYGTAVVSQKIYIFHEKTIHTFHIKTYEWETLNPRHNCMKGAAFTSQGTMIYCFGSSSRNYSDKIRCFDTVQNKWLQTQKMKAGRFNSAAVSLGESVYITGGFWGYEMLSYVIYLMGYTGGNDVEKYTPQTKECSKVVPMLTPRENHFCTSVNEKIYVCGGGLTNGFTNSVEEYDPLADKWSYISPMPSATSRLSMVTYRGKIYALQGERKIVCFESYNPESRKWNPGLPFLNKCSLECRLCLVCGVEINEAGD